jgi:hypothetical protein
LVGSWPGKSPRTHSADLGRDDPDQSTAKGDPERTPVQEQDRTRPEAVQLSPQHAGGKDVGEVRARQGVVMVVEALDRGILDPAVHPLDPAVRPGMAGLGQWPLNC